MRACRDVLLHPVTGGIEAKIDHTSESCIRLILVQYVQARSLLLDPLFEEIRPKANIDIKSGGQRISRRLTSRLATGDLIFQMTGSAGSLAQTIFLKLQAIKKLLLLRRDCRSLGQIPRIGVIVVQQSKRWKEE